MQIELFKQDAQISDIHPNLPTGFVYSSVFLAPTIADELFQYLISTLHWQQPSLKVYGKQHLIPRLQCWMGDDGVRYKYSGEVFSSNGWDLEVHKIKQRVEKQTGYLFNSTLINFYRNGEDKMGWHADDESELGRAPAIATISLGEQRTFQIKHNNGGDSINVELQNGSLLLMKPGVQANYKHAVPARKRVSAGRISLTFRHIINI